MKKRAGLCHPAALLFSFDKIPILWRYVAALFFYNTGDKTMNSKEVIGAGRVAVGKAIKIVERKGIKSDNWRFASFPPEDKWDSYNTNEEDHWWTSVPIKKIDLEWVFLFCNHNEDALYVLRISEGFLAEKKHKFPKTTSGGCPVYKIEVFADGANKFRDIRYKGEIDFNPFITHKYIVGKDELHCYDRKD